jgi:outer membrane murein-binding lipoprotein Lpp
MQYLIAAVLALSLTLPAAAQQPIPHPTADQVTVQILENEARSYRATIGQLAVQVNDLTAKADALGKERDELKAKCGKPCEAGPAK